MQGSYFWKQGDKLDWGVGENDKANLLERYLSFYSIHSHKNSNEVTWHFFQISLPLMEVKFSLASFFPSHTSGYNKPTSLVCVTSICQFLWELNSHTCTSKGMWGIQKHLHQFQIKMFLYEKVAYQELHYFINPHSSGINKWVPSPQQNLSGT